MRRQIQIQLTAADPPTGTIMRVDCGTSHPFVGWLDLLRVLAGLIAADEDARGRPA